MTPRQRGLLLAFLGGMAGAILVDIVHGLWR